MNDGDNPTHDEEELQNDEKVHLGLPFYEACGGSPVIQEKLYSQQEEDDIGSLKTDEDAVKVEEFRA